MDKTGFVSVIGRPNVGKSTLLNRYIGEKISIISDKPQTTRDKIKLIYSDEDSQIVFLDTPGMQKPKNKLGDSMLRASKGSLSEADLVLYLVDTSNFIGEKDAEILNTLKDIDAKIILVINKIDEIPKENILEIISLYKDYDFIDEFIPISATTGEGTDILLERIKENLPEGPRYYPDDFITDRSERFIVEEIIREKALVNLRDEVPHGINIEVESMKESKDGNTMIITATIYVEKDSHKGIVLGKGGSMVRKIRVDSAEDIKTFLDMNVNLELWVKVEKNWREKDNKVKYFGYE